MSKQNVGAAGLAEVGGRTIAVERRFRQSVLLPKRLHDRAEVAAERRGVSISTLLAMGLALALKDPKPQTRTARDPDAIKTSVALSGSLRAKAKRALAAGGTLQSLIVDGLERLLGE